MFKPLSRAIPFFCATVLMAAPSTESAVKPNLIVSEKVCFFHFIDSLSGWSPYCHRELIDHKYLGIPELGAKEQELLEQYAKARKPFDYEEEMALFAWANQGFPLEGKPKAYGELKQVLEHLYAMPAFAAPLKKRTEELKKIEPKIKEQLEGISSRMAQLSPVMNAFQHKECRKWQTLPIYAVYTLSKGGQQGGANGPGIYGEIDPAASQKRINEQSVMFLHEALHKAICPRECFEAFLSEKKDKSSQTKHSSMEEFAPGEFGNNEYACLDEILVYSLADVIVGGDNPDLQYKASQRQKNKTFQRTWDGVRLLLPTIRQQLAKPEPKDVFLAKLIDVFMEKVHYKVWKTPEA